MNDEALLRYSRHILLPQMDIDGQQRLMKARVLIIGAGGLGSPVIQYLAASGIGHLEIVDDDVVELSNVQRQICHGTSDVGRSKALSAKEEVARINPFVEVKVHETRADEAFLSLVAETTDLIVDCSDNFAVRYAINRVCYEKRIPWVSGAAVGLQGQLICFLPDQDMPCYQCLYPQAGDDTRNCSTSGILSPVVGVIGTLQAVEALKILSGIGTPVAGRLQTYDAVQGEWRSWQLPKDPECPVCSGAS